MGIVKCLFILGALMVSGLLCSFLVILGTNKKKTWKLMKGYINYEK